MDQIQLLNQAVSDLYNKYAWLNGAQMAEKLKEYQSSEVHCLEVIGKTKDPNVTQIASQLYMTRGAISKMTRKLIKKEAIESYRKADNKKEVYFRLTRKGQAAFDTHEALHEEFRKRDQPFFDSIPEVEFAAVLDFVQKFSQHVEAELAKEDIQLP